MLGKKFQFGRTPSFNDVSVSVQHFTITANDSGVYYILDSNSATGTKLNTKTIKPKEWHELREGVKIFVGPYMFQFSYTYVPHNRKEKRRHKDAAGFQETQTKTLTKDGSSLNKRKTDKDSRQQNVAHSSKAKPQSSQPQSGSQRTAAVTPAQPLHVSPARPLARPADPQSVYRARKKMSGEYTGAYDLHKNDNTFLVGMASLNIIIFAILLMSGGDLQKMEHGLMLKFGANTPHLTTQGQWWRLFSAAFLHWDIWHLVGNVGAMYFATAHIIKYLTPNKIIAVYLGSILFSSVLSTLLQPAYVVSAGASGAVFGLYGAIIVSAILYRNRGVVLDKGLLFTAIYFAWQNLGIGDSSIDIWAHLGGLAGGALICYLCVEMLPENDTKSAGVLFASLAAVTLAVVMALPKRHMPTERVIGIYFDTYMQIMNDHLKNIKTWDIDHNISRYEQADKFVVGSLQLNDTDLKATPFADERGERLKNRLLRFSTVMRSHAHYVKHYLKTNNSKSFATAKKFDKELGITVNDMMKELGMAVPAKTANASKQRARVPAARSRTPRKAPPSAARPQRGH